MSKYTLGLSRSSKKILDKSDRIIKERIINVIHATTENPYSYLGAIKLSGFDSIYRVRVGKYRIIYQILDEN